MSAPELIVDIAVLRRSPGTVHRVRGSVVLDGLETTLANVPGGRVDLDLSLENAIEGVVAAGRIVAEAQGECRRCLEPVADELDLSVREIFEGEPTEGETWPIVDDRVDLEPMIREAVLLALPLAPLCRDDCPGPEPERFPTLTASVDPVESPVPVDPRWSALDQLRLDE
jgi:uncharacterized protein